jgi:putative iron-regulated protein
MSAARANGTRLATAGLLMMLTACGGGGGDDGGSNNPPPPPPATGFDASDVLSALATDTIFATYTEMNARTTELLDAVNVLAAGNVTRTTLQAAQDVWIAARVPWEGSEGFLWGPIDTQGLDPGLDSWPVDKVQLDDVIASNLDLSDQAVIDTLDTTVKGFHTIEYLLFNDGTGNEDTYGCGAAASGTDACLDNIIAALTSDPRRLEYLVGITIDVNDVAASAAEAWDTAGGDYITTVEAAGQGSAVYTSQRSVIQEVVQGLIGITDEVANAGKINDPFTAHDPLTVESKFSGNSLTDFQYNIRSIRNIYCGSYDASTDDTATACGNAGDAGLTAFIADQDADLDATLRTEIDDAIAAIGLIPEPFEQAVIDSATDADVAATIQGAIDAINVLKGTLEGEVTDLVADAEFVF